MLTPEKYQSITPEFQINHAQPAIAQVTTAQRQQLHMWRQHQTIIAALKTLLTKAFD